MAKPIEPKQTEEKAKRYVFKITGKPGSQFTARFYDGTVCKININDNNVGKYAFIGKHNCHVFQLWDKEPSEEEAAKVLRRLKFYKNK